MSAKKRRRSISVFGMSFLDVMFCGFGSVILLVMLVNADTIERRKDVSDDLRAQVERLEREILKGERHLLELESSLERTAREEDVTASKTRQVAAQMERIRGNVSSLRDETQSRSASVDTLKSTLIALDAESKELEAASAHEADEEGTKVRTFIGEGNRQYLTGIKMGGRRILVLVDASASMLDETIVNVIRRRNLSAKEKRSAPKWQKALAAAEWLVSQLPPSSQFQIYTFNTRAQPVLEGSATQWLQSRDAATVNQAVAALRETIPGDGTSLHHAFAAIASLQPRPDNVFLLTDGLPTQGASKPLLNKVSGKGRLKLFEKALGKLPSAVPINIILYPMEGDPFAASAFWKLAASSKGSFITPSRDWP